MTDITLLDGGMGQELIRRSGAPASPLWSTQVLIDDPALVTEVHRDYAKAGATVATSNSYALHRDRLRGGSNHYAADGLDLPDREAEFESLLDAAMAAVAPLRGHQRVAGSIGPLAASYRPDLHPDLATAIPLYAEVACHIAPQADLLLFETIASLEAAEATLAAGRKTNLPVWLSFTVDDTDGRILRSGEPLSAAAHIAADADAVLVNCSAPEAMLWALEALSRAGRPFGAYANGFQMLTKDFIKGGTTADDLAPRRDLGPDAYAAHVLAWVDQGATIVGGCCEVGPTHIAEIATRLENAGHKRV